MRKIRDSVDIKDGSFVTVTEMNHLTEVQFMEKRTPSGACPIKKIDSEHYVLLQTGEVRKFNKSDNRSESADSLRKTMKKLRYKINNNFSGEQNELFLTLTYAENMTDTKRLYRDFDVFMKRLKRRFKGFDIKYLTVIEPQQRGAWHCHVLLKIPKFKGYLYISNADVEALWEHGFTNTRKITPKNCDNIGAYLTTYLTDVEVPLDSEVGEIKEVEIHGKKTSKKFVKGGRLNLYPSGVNFYRSSRNCSHPVRKIMTYADVLKKNLGLQVYVSEFAIVDTRVPKNDAKYDEKYEGRLLNRMRFEVYNKLRESA